MFYTSNLSVDKVVSTVRGQVSQTWLSTSFTIQAQTEDTSRHATLQHQSCDKLYSEILLEVCVNLLMVHVWWDLPHRNWKHWFFLIFFFLCMLSKISGIHCKAARSYHNLIFLGFIFIIFLITFWSIFLISKK